MNIPFDRRAPILVVDDEESALRSIRRTLRTHGLENVLVSSKAEEAVDLVKTHEVQVLLLDLIMPGRCGEDILAEMNHRFPEVPVIVVTAEYDVRTAVRAMKLGALDYLLKPVESDQLVATVQKALEQSTLRTENRRLREHFFSDALEQPEAFSDIVTQDPGMIRLFSYLESIARGSQAVLILGETGTGKELIAQALHRVSLRDGPFIAVNVAGLDDTLFADTLFGHSPGAFTGALEERQGMIDRAGGGTLFLDEIGDLSEASQVKLLRLLQEREYFPLGSDTPRELQARVVAATHRDPTQLRQDLYYRLRSYRVELPPLRRRLEDLPLLIARFLQEAADDLEKPCPTIPSELFHYLANYEFPGNIRELQSMCFDAVARHRGGVMSMQPFLDQIEASGAPIAVEPPGKLEFPSPMPTLRRIEQAAVLEALRRVAGNQSAAARMLGISRPTISRNLHRADGDELTRAAAED